eukprot:6234051-Amphidinium_carterae.2
MEGGTGNSSWVRYGLAKGVALCRAIHQDGRVSCADSSDSPKVPVRVYQSGLLAAMVGIIRAGLLVEPTLLGSGSRIGRLLGINKQAQARLSQHGRRSHATYVVPCEGTDHYIHVLKHTDLLKDLQVADRLLSLHTVAGTCKVTSPAYIWVIAPTHAGLSDLARGIRDRAMSQGDCAAVAPTEEEIVKYQETVSQIATNKF